MRFSALRSTVPATSLSLVALGFGGCSGEDEAPAPGGRVTRGPHATNPGARPVNLPRGVHALLPTGWQLLRKPISGVAEPAQVLSGASNPVNLEEPPAGGCRPSGVLDQRPPGGVLVQVIEYNEGGRGARKPNLDDFPQRQRAFRLPKGSYGSYECNGPSRSVAFRDHGRALQAFVWLHPDRVDPHLRRQAIELLSSTQFRGQMKP